MQNGWRGGPGRTGRNERREAVQEGKDWSREWGTCKQGEQEASVHSLLARKRKECKEVREQAEGLQEPSLPWSRKQGAKRETRIQRKECGLRPLCRRKEGYSPPPREMGKVT